MTTVNAGAVSPALAESDTSTDAGSPSATSEEGPLTAESLIEEVSIDGMCGVY